MTKTHTFQVLSGGKLLGSCKAESLRQANANLLHHIDVARGGAPITGPAHDLSQIISYEVRQNGRTIVESFACGPVRPIALDAVPSLVTS